MHEKKQWTSMVCGLHGTGAGGFTLLEVLIAIFIIGLLSALLLPAIARSKASTRDTRCLNNLHQIGMALQLYVDDNDNRLPTMFDSPISSEAGVTNTLAPT